MAVDESAEVGQLQDVVQVEDGVLDTLHHLGGLLGHRDALVDHVHQVLEVLREVHAAVYVADLQQTLVQLEYHVLQVADEVVLLHGPYFDLGGDYQAVLQSPLYVFHDQVDVELYFGDVGYLEDLLAMVEHLIFYQTPQRQVQHVRLRHPIKVDTIDQQCKVLGLKTLMLQLQHALQIGVEPMHLREQQGDEVLDRHIGQEVFLETVQSGETGVDGVLHVHHVQADQGRLQPLLTLVLPPDFTHLP